MVNYGAAFKLPFSNLKRSAILFFVLLLASLAGQIINLLIYGNNKYDPYQKPELTLGRIGIVILLYTFSIIVYTFISGYSFRLVGSATRGQNVMPSFEGFWDLLGRGLQYLAALLIYAIPFAVAVVFAVGLMALLGSPASIIIGMLLLLPLFIFGLVFFAYVMPMLLANFAHEKAFGAFFAIKKGFGYAFTIAYFVPWLVGIAYAIGIGLAYLVIYLPIFFVSLAVPFAGFIIVPFSALYSIIITLTMRNLYGQAYYDILAKPRAAAPVAEPKARHRKK